MLFCPGANAYEKSGTFTNTCGDLQLVKKAGEVSGSKSDFEMIVRVADAMGADIRNWSVRRASCGHGTIGGAQSGRRTGTRVLTRTDWEPKIEPV